MGPLYPNGRSSDGPPTSRGRGVVAPKVVRLKNEAAYSDFNAMFVDSVPECLGYDKDARALIYGDAAFLSERTGVDVEMDFIVVLQAANGSAEIHGVKISNWENRVDEATSFYQAVRPYFDKVWLVGWDFSQLSQYVHPNVPGAGVVSLSQNPFFRAEPKPQRGDGEFSGDVAKSLLLKRPLLQ